MHQCGIELIELRVMGGAAVCDRRADRVQRGARRVVDVLRRFEVDRNVGVGLEPDRNQPFAFAARAEVLAAADDRRVRSMAEEGEQNIPGVDLLLDGVAPACAAAAPSEWA